MIKMVCFDMDGSITNLYGVENWLSMLRAEDPTPYRIASPMWDMEKLAEIIKALMTLGIEVHIITWLSKGSSEEYKTVTRKVKREWLDKYNFPYNTFHGIQYGRTKADSVRSLLNDDEEAILIDDNSKVRNGWHLGRTIDPTAVNLIEVLKQLAEMEMV